MIFKLNLIATAAFTLLFSNIAMVNAQCFPNEAVTAAFATGGTSPNKSEVLWLTWGTPYSERLTSPNGKHNQEITNGTGSYASLNVGDGKYLCVEAKISELAGTGGLRSYAPGNYSGDSMDDLYYIGGTGTNNTLVSGLRNHTDGGLTTFKVTCKAKLDGIPIKLFGMVIGDAESLASAEYFTCQANGNWNVVEVKKNTTKAAYNVRKVNLPGNSQRMEFVGGNDDNTAAIAYCAFNDSAFSGDDYEVVFEIKLKGGGLTALSLGLLLTGLDGGDAPLTYGKPYHMVEKYSITSDGITPVADGGTRTNLNTTSYTSGTLTSASPDYLGTKAPDLETSTIHSDLANGDNNAGAGGAAEEDAWPSNDNLDIQINETSRTLTANIKYKVSANSHIAGWIDFNKNGVFDESEKAVVAAPSNATAANLVWNLPVVDLDKTFIRLRLSKILDNIQSPTTIAGNGEVEDHYMTVIGSKVLTNPTLIFKAN